MNVFVILPILLPIAGAAIIAILGRIARKESEGWNLTYAIIANVFFLGMLGVVIGLYSSVGTIPDDQLFFRIGGDIGAVFKLGPLQWWLMLVFSILSTIVAIFSIRYMDHDDRIDRYYFLLLILVAGMIGVVMAGDMLTLFVFWETMSIASYVLVAFRKEQPDPIEAGIKYLFMSAFGSVVLLFGMSLLYGVTGTLNIEAIGSVITDKVAANGFSAVYYIIIICLILGFGVKAAIVPLHTWLPDAHPAAPSGISAMLSGVVIMTGMYGMINTLTNFFRPSNTTIGYLLLWIAIVTMVVGNLLALRQNDIKRLLAFSTVLNVGFILFGLSMSLTGIDADIARLGVQGGWFHIFTHSLGKGLAFLCAGAILYRIEERGLDKLEGIGKKMPWTMTAFTFALLSLAGVPPLPGFWSKLNMVVAAVGSENWQYYVGVALFLLSSVISVVYYLIVLQRLWFKEPGEHLENIKETPVEILVPLYVLVVLMLIVGILPGVFSELASNAALALLPAS
ncbi:MAG TPA: complex I subunit 5 family protein [candidate division Zixibacteria bacterium]|nr:complex I subunit 5 family protein [candidate division Zixibacteria bacterium]